jgi:hypothetical protein
VFSPVERKALQSRLLEAARSDSRIKGAAITGSASVGKEDRWSDIDLAFGVRESTEVAATLADFTERMYGDHDALHHLDVLSGAWIYRVFLLQNTLQVDLAFAPASDFRARAPTFKLAFRECAEPDHAPATRAEDLIGWAWLYALHARSSIAREKLWQAEHMISGMRDQALALACLRHNLPAREGRGIDGLPSAVKEKFEDTLVRVLWSDELLRAFRVTTYLLRREIRLFDAELAAKLEPALLKMAEIS